MLNTMMYDPSTEFTHYINRINEYVKLAHQAHKRELEKKDEEIQSLHKRIDFLQYESREFTDFKRLSEKENRELLSTNQSLRHENSLIQAELERVKDEGNRLRSELASQDDKIAHLEAEHEKANHIIKTLLKKFQVKPGVRVPPDTV